MSIKLIQQALPDYAEDIRQNFEHILSGEGAKGLTENQRFGASLASVYATQNSWFIQAFEPLAKAVLSDAEVKAAKSAASIMAMTNVYFRTVGLVADEQYAKMSTGLKMKVIAKPGINRVDFDLYSLAVSALNGCQHCLDTHIRKVTEGGLTPEGVQSSFKIAAVISAVSQAQLINKGN